MCSNLNLEFSIFGVFSGIEPATSGPTVLRSDQLSYFTSSRIEGRRKNEEGRRKKEEGRRKKKEERKKKKEGRSVESSDTRKMEDAWNPVTQELGVRG